MIKINGNVDHQVFNSPGYGWNGCEELLFIILDYTTSETFIFYRIQLESAQDIKSELYGGSILYKAYYIKIWPSVRPTHENVWVNFAKLKKLLIEWFYYDINGKRRFCTHYFFDFSTQQFPFRSHLRFLSQYPQEAVNIITFKIII